MYQNNGIREFVIVDFIDKINNKHYDSKRNQEPMFELIAGDLVYVPSNEEIKQKDIKASQLNKDRIYKFISTNPTSNPGKPDVNFIPHRYASLIFSDNSDTYKLKKKVPGSSKCILHGELSITRSDSRIKVVMPDINNEECTQMPVIRDICWKIEVDRLGNIIKIIR